MLWFLMLSVRLDLCLQKDRYDIHRLPLSKRKTRKSVWADILHCQPLFSTEDFFHCSFSMVLYCRNPWILTKTDFSHQGSFLVQVVLYHKGSISLDHSSVYPISFSFQRSLEIFYFLNQYCWCNHSSSIFLCVWAAFFTQWHGPVFRKVQK